MSQHRHTRQGLAALMAAWFAALCLLPSPAHAQTIRKIFTKNDIYRMSVEGIRLNTLQEDAGNMLVRSGWTGKWPEFSTAESGYAFRKNGQVIYLMRYRDNDSQLRIWSVVSKQPFNRPDNGNMPMNHVLGQVWIDSVVSHYGEPSIDFINPNGINAYVYYLSNQFREDAPRLEIYLSSGEASYELSDRSLITPPH